MGQRQVNRAETTELEREEGKMREAGMGVAE